MKRIIKTLLVVMALCLVLVAFTGCDAAINKVKDTLFPPKPCTHQGGTATCAIQAVCELCGESYGDLLDHQWAEGTCTTRPSCSVCGTVNGDNIAGHTIVEDEGYAATCTEPGLTDGKHCSKCNTILVAQFVIDPIGHDIPEATCTTGSVCNNCGVTFGYPLGHSWVAATCTVAKTCSVCEVTEGDPLGHDMKDVEAKDNTCTEDGYSAHKACSRCDHKEGFEVDAAAHSVKVEFVAPTADANGKVRFYCSACEDYEVIEYAGAALMTGGVYTLNPGDFPVNEEEGVYKDGEVKFLNGFGIHLSGKFRNQENTKKFEDGYQSTHRFHFGGDTKYTDSMIRNAISFTTAGNTTLKVWWGAGDADRELVIYNLATGEKVTVTSTEKAKNDLCISEFTLPAGSYLLANTPKTNYYHKVEVTVEAPHTHTYTPVVTAPTCTEAGYTTHTCGCGDSYVDSEVAALGHKHEAVVTDPTCTEVGYTTHTCHCGDTYKDSEVAALGHKYESVVTAPTCTKDGFTTHTCHCGDTYTDSVVPARHTLEEVSAKAPTCTEAGYTAHKACEFCNYTEGYEELPAAHKLEDAEGKDPTCTEAGYTAHKKCANCDYTEGKDSIAATGHSYVDGICDVCDAIDPNHYFEMSISEVLAAADNTKVKVTGTVAVINTPWDDDYGNMTVTIVDAEGTELYVYRMKTNVSVGDIITIKGTNTTHNSKKQINSGATADIIGHDSSYDYNEVTILEALASEKGTNVIVTGTVIEINGKWDSYYKNMNVTIADENGNRLYVFRLSTQVALNDIITVKGTVDIYNGAPQIGQGGTATIDGAHVCSKYGEATCKNPAACVVCGAYKDDVLGEHDYVEGSCSVCGGVDPDFEGEVNVTTYKKVTSASEITTGTYVLVIDGYVMTRYDASGWVLVDNSFAINADGTITDPNVLTWTVTVSGSSATLQDSTGNFIKPKAGNNNGIQTGSYNWAWSIDSNGFVQFKGTGSDTTTLAANKQSAYKIRAYKNGTISGNVAGYPCTFELYKLVEN